ncbi:glycosyltransferase [Octadecabacter ascidiaceicola]|nr:glycosyltransferase [Octadecabacter ascidiaceicola]
MQRFYLAVRQEGLAIALRKARVFIAMLWRGEGQSALNADGATVAPEHYLQSIWQQLAKGEAFHPTPPDKDSRRFIAIIGDLNLPQCRKYRVEQLAEFWAGQGVACEFAHFQDLPRVTRLLTRATHMIEYRLQSSPVTEMIRYEARRLRLPIMYDIDDPLFSISAYETYGNMGVLDPAMKTHFVAEAPRYLAMMNGADMVSVSTPQLAQHCRLFTERPVHVRRNFADDATLMMGAAAMKARNKDDGVFRVGFASGSQGHEADLASIFEPLERFFEGNAHRLVLLGHFDLNRLPDVLRSRADIVPFTTYENYLHELAGVNCTVMPLCDDTFNRCKSAVRVIDAASVGVPSIVAPVGDLPNLIVQGKTGFVANNQSEWHTALGRFEGARDTTRCIGREARRQLETHWSGIADPHIIDPEILDWVLR